jgi:hypothetical protein
MVILLNTGTNVLTESVFYYKPKMITENLRLCHPNVWAHARIRTDESKLNELDLLTCYTGDER